MDQSAYIERLKQRIREKPDSKLFLSLAEEYRKNDNIDDAMVILIEGIKKNPDFLAARLTLGRWYLLGNMFTEAKKEFSEITGAAPNNIYALKGLAEALENMGFIKDAVAAHRKILEINPLDKEAALFINAVGIEPTAIDTIEQEAAPDLIPHEEIQETAGLPVETELAGEVREAVTSAEEPIEAIKVNIPEQLTEAERLIADGRYRKALKIFNNMLSSMPDDKKILQMKGELLSLMKLVGKDKDSMIKRLNAFMFLVNDRFIVQKAKRKEAAVNRLNALLDSIKNQFTYGNTSC